MLLAPFRWALTALTTLLVLYVFFFVPLGERTLFEHVKRIAGTPEARELGRDVQRAGERVYETARDELNNGLPSSAGDGGARPTSPAQTSPRTRRPPNP